MGDLEGLGGKQDPQRGLGGQAGSIGKFEEIGGQAGSMEGIGGWCQSGVCGKDWGAWEYLGGSGVHGGNGVHGGVNGVHRWGCGNWGGQMGSLGECGRLGGIRG